MSTSKAQRAKARSKNSRSTNGATTESTMPAVSTEGPSRQDLLTDAMGRIDSAKSISAMVGYWLSNHEASNDDEMARASLALLGVEDLLDSARELVDNAWPDRGAQS
ncbi:MAG TPA: hypothetical protein VIY90_12150 [Steroidobacteraceae bacterium]